MVDTNASQHEDGSLSTPLIMPVPDISATPTQPSPTPPPPTTSQGSPPELLTHAAAVPPAQQQQERDVPVDPRVVELRSMFPDYDDLVLQSVLESVLGDQDRAVDLLLSMSDPEYKGEPTQADATPQQTAMSQTELDEQFARRLLLEEERQQQHAWLTAQQHQQHPQSYQRPVQQGGGVQQSQQQTDTMAEIQQQFTRIAETGKKTFGTIFNKVKTKLQEFDQQRQGQGSSQGQALNSGNGPAAPRWSYSGYNSAEYEQRISNQPPQPSYATRPDAHPALTSERKPSPELITFADTDSSQASRSITGYDTTPASARDVSTPSSGSALLSTTPPKTIDGAKFGLLPKRPVSLVSPGVNNALPATAHKQRHQDESDDDDLEYTENPFEEGKK